MSEPVFRNATQLYRGLVPLFTLRKKHSCKLDSVNAIGYALHEMLVTSQSIHAGNGELYSLRGI